MHILHAINYLISLTLLERPVILVSVLSSFTLGVVTNSDFLCKMYKTLEFTKNVNSLTTFAILFLLSLIFIVVGFIITYINSGEGEPCMKDRVNIFGVFVGKFFGVVLYSSLAAFLVLIFDEQYILSGLLYTPMILTILKEFINIGEEFERRFGKKSYIFSVVDKAFDLIELKYFKKLS